MEPAVTIKLLKLHHIVIPPNLTIRGARYAMVTHLIAGTSTGSSKIPASTTFKCKCKQTRGIFDSQQLPASLERLPDAHITLVAETLVLSERTRSNLNE
jgi:hypothetical protein